MVRLAARIAVSLVVDKSSDANISKRMPSIKVPSNVVSGKRPPNPYLSTLLGWEQLSQLLMESRDGEEWKTSGLVG